MTPIEKIIDWAKDKPVFWRHTIRLLLQKGEIKEKQFELIYSIAKMEYGIIEKGDVYPMYELPISASGYQEEVSEIKLAVVKNVINVGSLATNQELIFNINGLNIVYGDNGAGKSSYARILKHACLTRGDIKPILSNVFEQSNVPSSAYLGITDEQVSIPVSWTLENEQDVNLKSIRVFDTDTADHYVSKEDSLGYKPFPIKVLESLSDALKYVKRQIEEELMPGNGAVNLPRFSSETKAGLFIFSLNALTDDKEVDQHIATDAEIANIAIQEQYLFKLKSKTAETLRKELKGKKKRIQPLLDFIEPFMASLSDTNFDVLNTLQIEAFAKEEVADKLRQSVLNNLPFEGIGGSEWATLWKAAKDFLIIQPNSASFPSEVNDKCPLCLQNIESGTAEKLKHFQTYISDSAAKEAAEAKLKLKQHRNKIDKLNIDISPYSGVLSEFNTDKNNLETKIISFIGELIKRKEKFLNATLPVSIDSLNSSALDECKDIVINIDEEIEKLKDDETQANLIAEKEAILVEVKDRKLIKENYDSIIKKRQRLLLELQLNLILQDTNPRLVTAINAEISKSILIEPMVENFKQELKKFGFDRFDINVKTRGNAGEQLVKLQISQGNKKVVSQVASEGEQRCIAIACFMAEMKADGRKSAVIFDDPVNSLDHKWRESIGERLVNESLERQVIVFTHDIVFYKYLLELVESTIGADIHQIRLDRSRKQAGIVDLTPPWDALPIKSRIGQLKSFYQQLEKIDRLGTETEYQTQCHDFYCHLRESWERLVEERLLNGVVTRFGRSVQTQRVSKLVGDKLSQADYDILEKGMDSCSTYFKGHDTAAPLQQRARRIEEIKADLIVIDDFNTSLKKRR
jgi:energy-coupling factor transporter ATP-binding protein EcfA2